MTISDNKIDTAMKGSKMVESSKKRVKEMVKYGLHHLEVYDFSAKDETLDASILNALLRSKWCFFYTFIRAILLKAAHSKLDPQNLTPKMTPLSTSHCASQEMSL
jgi:hypothetical protein